MKWSRTLKKWAEMLEGPKSEDEGGRGGGGGDSQEEKDLEFDLAHFGAPQLETVFAALFTQQPDAMQQVLNALNIGPRKVLDLAINSIEVGAQAELTLFDPSLSYQANMRPEQWRFSPFNQLALQGQIIGVIRGAHASIAQD